MIMACKKLLVLVILLSLWHRVHGNIPVTVTAPAKPPAQSNIATGKCEGMQYNLSLNFRNVGLQRIDSDFANSTNVSCLSLEDNEIAYVSPTAFRLTPNLLFLNLAQNKLSLANFSHLDGHLNLRTLILDNNNDSQDIDSSKIEFKNKFPRLLHLYLRGCGIEDVTSLAFAPILTHLYLSSNNLANSELTFLDDVPATLIGLDLVNTGIRSLNASKLSSVQELRLDENQIKRLCGKSYCHESALVLEGARDLRKLSLARNGLTSVESHAFDDTEDLLDLDLSFNEIDTIRKNTFEKVGVMRNLTLKNNFLSEMPDLCGPETLQYLSLANNLLEVVKDDSFCMMKNLRYIDFSGNKIRIVENQAFAKQVHLELLNLSNNLLKKMPSTWLTPLMNLQILYMDGNRLERLNDLALDHVNSTAKLKHVYLQSNLITKFYTSSLFFAIRYMPNITIEIFDVAGSSNNLDRNATSIGVCKKCDCDENNDVSFNISG